MPATSHPHVRPIDRRQPIADPPAFALESFVCLEELASALDAIDAANADRRWNEIAFVLDHMAIKLREIDPKPRDPALDRIRASAIADTTRGDERRSVHEQGTNATADPSPQEYRPRSSSSDVSLISILRALVLAPLVFAACVPMTSSVGTDTGTGTSPSRSGQITVPNLFGLSRAQAIAALRSAGHGGDVTEDKNLCGSVVEGRVIELGYVCYQSPPAGRVQPARLPISIQVQIENPRHGNAGKVNEWRLLPNLVGVPLEQARARLKQAGFVRDDLVRVAWVDEPGCQPLTVCRTQPAWGRASVNSDQVLIVARDPSATPGAPTPAPDAR